jgi:hypothetical protein
MVVSPCVGIVRWELAWLATLLAAKALSATAPAAPASAARRADADRGLEFVSGHKLDPISAPQIPANMIGRLLDDGDLRKLHRMLIKKKKRGGGT